MQQTEERKLIYNIGQLFGTDDSDLVKKGESLAKPRLLENAWLEIRGDKIHSFGRMDERTAIDESRFSEVIDAKGGLVLPSWCDSHTHLVFAKSREDEFVDRIKGLSYEEIARNGGGILNSAMRLRETSEEDLFESARLRLEEIIAMGTGAVEIKSGYGLDTDSELKMLRVIRSLKEISPIPIRSTFLGAHAFPPEFKENKEGYINLLINEMLPIVADEKLADYMDVFCDRGFFSAEQTDRLLEAGHKYGLKPKIHANELDYSGGIQIGVKHAAVSVDHLECTGDEEIAALQKSETIASLLPQTAFFLGIDYPPARKIIDAGIPVALASDYNPGSSPSGNMFFTVSLACIKMKMLPEEALLAATINGAHAMELQSDYGSIKIGKKANLILSKYVNYNMVPYAFGRASTSKILINGRTY